MTQRIELIGAGIIADCHAGGVHRLPGEVELHVADPNPEALKTFCEKYPEAIPHSSSEEMCATPAGPQDIVINCTPPWLHHPETLNALRRGRHVLCEKPFALNMEQAEEMVALAEEQGVQIGCCSKRHATWELHQKACQMVADGVLGRIYRVDWIHRDSRMRRGIDGRSRGIWWSLEKAKAGGGRLMDFGPYDVSIWVDLFQPTSVTVSNALAEEVHIGADLPQGLVPDVETHLSATLTFTQPDGNTFHLEYERTSATHGPEYHHDGVYGLDAYMTWNSYGHGTPEMKIRSSGPLGEIREEVITADPPYEAWHCQEPLLNFAAHIAGEASPHALTGKDILRNHAIMMAIYDCADSKSPVTLAL